MVSSLLAFNLRFALHENDGDCQTENNLLIINSNRITLISS